MKRGDKKYSLYDLTANIEWFKLDWLVIGQVMGEMCETVPFIPCPMNYYGPDCSCRDTNDCSGHFECDRVTGEKVCLTGWLGDDCTIKDPLVDDPTCVSVDCGPGTCFNGGCCCPDGEYSLYVSSTYRSASF